MPDFLSIIKEKNRRLESVPEEFLSRVKKSERQVYENVIELLSSLEQKSGQFVASVKNLRVVAQINDELKKALVGSEYTAAVTQFASEFDIQNEINFEYFQKSFELKSESELALAILQRSKANAIDLLLNTGAESSFLKPLQGIIENSVINNAGYKDTLFAIREFIEGAGEFDSRLLSYSKQISHDTFAIADRALSSTYADELDIEWFFYSGDVIPTSRAFCKERHNKYYYYKEIEAWGAGQKTEGLMLPFKDGHWDGQRDGTTKDTIYSYAGGYWCGHTIMGVSIFDVPIDVIQRNIDQGFFTPTDKERELIGL